MGAIDATYDTKLPKDATDAVLEAAFIKIRDSEAYMNGHGGYTGTIAEANWYKIRRDLEFVDEHDIYEHIPEFAEKWGPAIAVFNLETATWWFAGTFSS